MIYLCIYVYLLQNGGFIVYGTTLKKDYPGNTLNGTGVRDRAHVFVDGVSQQANAKVEMPLFLYFFFTRTFPFFSSNFDPREDIF